MTIKQLSIFIENKAGRLETVLSLLKDAQIQLIATTLADTADFGILRILCADTSRAYDVLTKAGVAVTYTDVFAIEIDNRPGMAADAMASFARAGIDVSYLYSFLLGGRGVLIFRTSDTERAREIIVLEKLRFLTDEALLRLATGK